MVIMGATADNFPGSTLNGSTDRLSQTGSPQVMKYLGVHNVMWGTSLRF